MATILVHISLLAYTAGAAAFLTWLVRADQRWVRAGRLLLLAGIVLHAGAFLAPADTNVVRRISGVLVLYVKNGLVGPIRCLSDDPMPCLAFSPIVS